MRKSFARLVVALSLLVSSTFLPARSNAMIALGGTTLGVSWAVAGVVAGASAGGAVMLAEKVKSKIAKGGLIAVAVVLGIGAILLLDEKSEGTIVWSEVNEAQASTAGLKDVKAIAEYNAAIPALNATQESLVVEVKKILHDRPSASEEEVNKIIEAGWQSAYSQLELSAAAIQVHKTIAQQAAKATLK